MPVRRPAVPSPLVRPRLRPLPYSLGEAVVAYRRAGWPFGHTWAGFLAWVRFHGGSRAN